MGGSSRRGLGSVLLTVLRLVLVIAAVTLGVIAIGRDVEGFLQALGDIGLVRALAAVGLTMVALRVSAEAWRVTVGCVAGEMPRSAATRVFFVSQLGKYLPGGLWTILAQVERARIYGLSHAKMGVAGLLFIGLHVVTGIVVAAVALPWGSRQVYAEYWWMALFALPALVSLFPPVLRWSIDRALRLLRRPPLEQQLPARAVGQMVAAFMVVWLIYGASVFVLAQPLLVQEVRGGAFLSVLGTWAAAWVIGVVIIPAPAGLGPREVVIFLLLSPVIGAAGATSLAIALRVLHTFSDLTLAGLFSWAPWDNVLQRRRPSGSAGGVPDGQDEADQGDPGSSTGQAKT